MNLSERFIKCKGSCKLPPELEWCPRPDPEDIVRGVAEDEELQNMWEAKNNFINYKYDNKVGKLNEKKKQLKLSHTRNKIIEIYILKWMCIKDDVIKCKNDGMTAMKIYDHREIPNTKKKIIKHYKEQKGFRRFSWSPAGYDFYMKTGREPWTCS